MKLEILNAHIATIGASEMAFKPAMGTASRDFLTYVSENGDIDAVNRLIAVLTPVNRAKVTEFFAHHLPYNFIKDERRFGGKNKNKDIVAKKAALCDDFLADGENTVWTWFAEQQVPAGAKPKEYEKKIEALVKKALEDKNERIPVGAVIRAVIKGGASLSEIMAAILPAVDEEAPAENQQPAEDKAAA